MPAALATLTTLLAKAKAVKKFADQVTALGRRNDEAAASAYAEERDAIVVETAQSVAELSKGLAEVTDGLVEFARLVMDAYPDWATVADEDELPTRDDVEAALLRYRGDYTSAGSQAKRKLLFAALLGEFNPKLYEDGWNRIFGDIARRLEPPHVDLLRRISATKGWFPLHPSKDVDAVLVRELEHLGLLLNPVEPRKYTSSLAAERFLEFLWAYVEPPGETPGR